MVKYDVVSLGLEDFRPFGDGCLKQSVHPVCRHLGDKQLGDQRKALVKGGIDTGNDHEEQKQQHEVDLSGQN